MAAIGYRRRDLDYADQPVDAAHDTDSAQTPTQQHGDDAPAPFRAPVGKAAANARARLTQLVFTTGNLARVGIAKIEQADLAPDLAQNIGSPRWFRGAATFLSLTAVALGTGRCLDELRLLKEVTIRS